jgi:hypothetical protein
LNQCRTEAGHDCLSAEVFWVNGKQRFRKIGQPFRQCRVMPKKAGRITLTGGTVFLMWLAEQVTSRGIGASDVIYG